MKFKLSVILILFISFANAEIYQFSNQAKGIEFLVSKNKKRDDGTFGNTDVFGQFSKYNGVFDYAKDGFVSNMVIKVNMSSVSTGIEKRDKHLKSAEFFDMEKYPYAMFSSAKDKKFKIDPAGMVVVKGKIKIKDVEKIISLKLTMKKTDNGLKISSPADFSLVINRLDYNVKHNMKIKESMLGELLSKFKKFVGQNVIGNTVSIRFNVNAKKKI